MVNETDGRWEAAQQSVIGSALISPETVPLILAECTSGTFSGVYRTIFDAIAGIFADGNAVDPVTVLDKLGGGDYKAMLLHLMQSTPTAANVSEYIRVANERSRLNAVNALGVEIAGAVDLQEARALINKAADATMDTRNDGSASASDCVQQWFDDLNEGKAPEYIRCGIGCIDSVVRTKPGNYHVLAGYTSHGKSAIAIQMAWEISETKSVGFFCLETPREEWTERMIALVSRVDVDHVQTKKLSQSEVERCTDACGKIYERRLRYEPAAGMTVNDIRARCIQRGYEVIFVDYIQNVAPPNQRLDAVHAVGEISKGLQQLALQRGITVFALSQLSRPPKDANEFTPLPGVSDLRESGQIEQDADAVIIVHAPLRFTEPRWRMISVCKNRHGQLRTFYSDFDGTLQCFREPTQTDFSRWKSLMPKAKGGGKSSTRKDGMVYPSELIAAQKKREAAEKSGETYRPFGERDEPAPHQMDLTDLAAKFPDVVKIQN